MHTWNSKERDEGGWLLVSSSVWSLDSTLLMACFNFAHFLASFFSYFYGHFRHLYFLLHNLLLNAGLSLDVQGCAYRLDNFGKLHDHLLVFVFKFSLVMIRKHTLHVWTEICSLGSEHVPFWQHPTADWWCMQSIVVGCGVLQTSVEKNRLTVFLRFFSDYWFSVFVYYENDTEILNDTFQFNCLSLVVLLHIFCAKCIMYFQHLASVNWLHPHILFFVL